MFEILNQKEGMEYRRFGKTEVYLSTITLGGMRFKQGQESPKDKIPNDTLEHCLQTVQMAFNAGINHIETAWGYGKSETVYGRVLNDELSVPRNSYHLMTKGNALSADEMYRMVESQLRLLQTDYLDFYGWHGINNDDLLKQSCKTGGPVEVLHKLKEEGVIKHIGFSTHAPLETIVKAIETDLFEFVNLHYYYFDQRNLPAVNTAGDKDMGVFIISPNDKGGQLFKAPEKIRKATVPLTPIQWNARFCLQNPAIHTLSFGITDPDHFEEMKGIFLNNDLGAEEINEIKQKLDSFINDDPFAAYDGYNMQNDPSGINIPQLLRLRKLWKCYNMKDYARYRYKIFEQKGHWFPGVYAFDSNIAKIDTTKIPAGVPLKEMLAEAHKEFYIPEFKLAKK
ncbi:aldo/keto reductase [Prolixibacteraceae bacterium Z1-6]|uniref:Aldo/keto reductase n=1 Tax=Draconibacterium aestuarii TaxID=2998507 RepID=A0A9X3F4J3_9BACT|nr:aldo/keto reductase [Prolixibacteraceae bacterium Z1-6]